MPTPEPTKTLILHIAVPGIWADDLPQAAAEWAATDEPTPQDYLDAVTEEWMRQEVGLTIVSLPGDGNLNDEYEVHAYDGRIVGAEVR